MTSLVSKVSATRKDHRHASGIRGLDHLFIPYRTPGLHNRSRASISGCDHAIREGKERVRREGRTRQRSGGLHHGDPRAINAAHLPRTDGCRPVWLREDDGVGLHVLADNPTKRHRSPLILCRLPFGHDLPGSNHIA